MQHKQNQTFSVKFLVGILTLGVFGIINTEMGIVGIIPLIAERFGVDVPTAGWTVSVFALVVAVSAPTLPLLFSGFDRKRMMLVALGLFTASNLMSMFAEDFFWLLVARILPALFHPVYVSMAFTVAAQSVDLKEAPRAVAKVFVGVSAGMVLGVPVTSFIASHVSYEAAMLVFTLVNATAFVLTLWQVPSMPAKTIPLGHQLSVLKRKTLWYSILSTILINGALFGFFSFMAEYLQRITLLSYDGISALLLVYGLASTLGASLGGLFLAKKAATTMLATPVVLIVGYASLYVLGSSFMAVAGLIFFLGVLSGVASNTMQYMIAGSAAEAPDFANGLFLASANLGTTLGTALCGAFISYTNVHASVLGSLLMLGLSLLFVRLRWASER